VTNDSTSAEPSRQLGTGQALCRETWNSFRDPAYSPGPSRTVRFTSRRIANAQYSRSGDRIRVAFVFGSVAAGTETSASDVDDGCWAITSLIDAVSAIAEAQREPGREINPSVYPTEELS